VINFGSEYCTTNHKKSPRFEISGSTYHAHLAEMVVLMVISDMTTLNLKSRQRGATSGLFITAIFVIVLVKLH